jgi:hypothetical protein
MAAHHDTGEFIDSDFQSAQQHGLGVTRPDDLPGCSSAPNRPPTREELEAQVSEKQIKLAELKRAQEDLERERASLEDIRRRQAEFQTGRSEMLQHLVRGIGLLEETELNARRDAEQMARALAEFRDTVGKVQAINELAWTRENYSMELTRAATTIENARMEWNAARLKFPLLAGEAASPGRPPEKAPSPLLDANLFQLSKIGLAISWPIVLLGTAIFLVLLLRR